jgi:Helicase
MREQYPVVVAEAITIHKSQGMSMKTVTVKLEPNMHRSLLYVACSRAVSLDGLFLIGEFKPPKAMKDNYAPKLEMDRMRQNAMLKPKFASLKEKNNNVLKICSYNIQSLRKHHGTVNADKVFTTCDLLLLQETWVLANEMFQISNMNEIQRNKFSSRPSAKGTIIYGKSNLNVCSQISAFEDAFGDQHIEMTFCSFRNLKIVNIYVNPKSSLQYLQRVLNIKKDAFENENVLLCGDFNVNFFKDSSIECYLESKFGLKLLSPREFTTDARSMIDAVFGKLEEYEVTATIYESYASFHKPILIKVKEKNN